MTGAPIISDPDIQRIAERHGVSAATALISYHVNKGVAVLPKSETEKRISSNKEVILLSKEDLDVLDNLAANGKAKRISTPYGDSISTLRTDTALLRRSKSSGLRSIYRSKSNKKVDHGL